MSVRDEKGPNGRLCKQADTPPDQMYTIRFQPVMNRILTSLFQVPSGSKSLRNELKDPITL